MAACDKRQKAGETGEEGSSSKRKWKSRVDKVRQWRHLPVIHFIFCVLGPNLALLVCIVLFALHTKQVRCTETNFDFNLNLNLILTLTLTLTLTVSIIKTITMRNSNPNPNPNPYTLTLTSYNPNPNQPL